jgi:MFS transporter, DHA2 family, multidrug resistance protein
MAIDLCVDPLDGQWIIVAFGLGMAAAIPFAPGLVAWLGPRAAFTAVLCVSVLAIAWCGVASSFVQVVASRGLQGVTSGCVVLLCQRLFMAEVGEQRRAFGLGLWSSAIAIAPVAGPFVGALAIEWLSWRALFLGQVPVLVACALLLGSELSVRITGQAPAPRALHALSLGLALLLVQLGMDAVMSIGETDSLLTVGYFAGAALSCAVLFASLSRAHARLFDWSLLADRSFVVHTVLGAGLNGLVMLTSLIYPLWLQTELGLGVLDVAQVLAAGGVIGGTLSPLIGRMKKKELFPLLVSAGFVLFVLSFWLSTRLDHGSSRFDLSLPRVLLGFGIACCSPLGFLAVAKLEQKRVLEANSLGMFARAIVGNAVVLIGSEGIRVLIARYREHAIADGYGANLLGKAEPSVRALSAMLSSAATTHAMHMVFGFCAAAACLFLLARAAEIRSAWQQATHLLSAPRGPSP